MNETTSIHLHPATEYIDTRLVRRANNATIVALVLLLIPLVIGIFAYLGSTQQLPNSLSDVGVDGSIALMATPGLLMIVVLIVRRNTKTTIPAPPSNDRKISHISNHSTVIPRTTTSAKQIAMDSYTGHLNQMDQRTYCKVDQDQNTFILIMKHPDSLLGAHVDFVKVFESDSARAVHIATLNGYNEVPLPIIESAPSFIDGSLTAASALTSAAPPLVTIERSSLPTPHARASSSHSTTDDNLFVEYFDHLCAMQPNTYCKTMRGSLFILLIQHPERASKERAENVKSFDSDEARGKFITTLNGYQEATLPTLVRTSSVVASHSNASALASATSTHERTSSRTIDDDLFVEYFGYFAWMRPNTYCKTMRENLFLLLFQNSSNVSQVKSFASDQARGQFITTLNGYQEVAMPTIASAPSTDNATELLAGGSSLTLGSTTPIHVRSPDAH